MKIIKFTKNLKNNKNKMIEGKKCSNIILKVRKIGKWSEVNTDELFKKKSGAFFDWLKSINASANIWEKRKLSIDIFLEVIPVAR